MLTADGKQETIDQLEKIIEEYAGDPDNMDLSKTAHECWRIAQGKRLCPYRQDLKLVCVEDRCDRAYCPIFEKESGRLAYSLSQKE